MEIKARIGSTSSTGLKTSKLVFRLLSLFVFHSNNNILNVSNHE